MSWFGTGLTLDEFLNLSLAEKRARLYELSDIDQLIFIDKHLDMVASIMFGFPIEDRLPETSPFAAMKALGVNPSQYGYQDAARPSAEIRKFPSRMADKNDWIH